MRHAQQVPGRYSLHRADQKVKYMEFDRWNVRQKIKMIKRRNLRSLEEAIQYLSEDEYSPGTGYVKEYLWRTLAIVPLTQRQREQLQSIGLRYLRRPITREFWIMCRSMSVIADREYREMVEQYVSNATCEVHQRALYLQAYLKSIELGESYKRLQTRISGHKA